MKKKKKREPLSRDAKILLMVGILFLSGMTIAATFVNVYLIRLTDNMGLMILQNVSNYIALLGSFLFGTYYVKKGSILTLLKVGIVSSVIYYSLILLLQAEASKYLIYLGIFNGIGMGMYYFAFNILVGKFTGEKHRATFFSYQTSFSYIFGVVAPMISGAVIVRYSELTGYYILFAFSVIVYILAIIISCLLKNVKFDEEYHVLPILKLRHNKYWNANRYYNFSFGLREAIYGQIFMVFAYIILNNEQIIGNLNSAMSLIGVLSSIFIASKFTLENQKKYHLWASIIYLISIGTLAIVAKPWSLVMCFILNGVILCWNSVIFQTMKYQLSSRAKDGFNDGDYIIACEFPTAAGRISGLLIFYGLNYFYGGFNLYRGLLLAVSLGLLIDHFVIDRKLHWMEDEIIRETS
ncbi:MAG: hypothetical protein ACLRVU_12425 [Beduini sp.]|uniref:hypothetical protein n=1 Tax=Beduini sp. TaxID=1922300 RepID=UPI0039A1F5F1